MGGNTWRGMHPERVHDIIGRLGLAKDTLTEAAASSDVAVNRLRGQWDGADAGSFFAGWPKLRQHLTDVAGHVDQLRKTLESEYEQQRRVSGAWGDSDGDGTPDSRDGDADGDGTPDHHHPTGSVKVEHDARDTDQDGVPDVLDPDDDGDGTPDPQDDDADNDGRPDDRDANDDDAIDTDHDGTPDTRDTDDDGDGTPDRDDPDHTGKDRTWEKEYHKDWVDNGPQHRQDPRYDVDAKVTVDQKEVSADAAWLKGGADLGHGLSVDGSAGEAEAHASSTSSIGKDGFTSELAAGTSVTALSVGAAYQNSHGTSAYAKGSVGAEANAQASASLGLDGFKAGAGVDAFAGGKLEAGGSQQIGPVDAGGSVEVSYGIGFEADADAEFTSDHVGVSLDLNATLGLGIGGEINIGFDPPW